MAIFPTTIQDCGGSTLQVDVKSLYQTKLVSTEASTGYSAMAFMLTPDTSFLQLYEQDNHLLGNLR